MEKTYKIVPFDIELAKKIQAGEIKGKILHNDEDVIILDYNSKVYPGYPIRFAYVHFDNIDYAAIEGIHIELPYSDNKPQFKPFDKILVREDDLTRWQAAFFSHIESFDGERFAITTSGDNYNLANNEIIPYEGNEHLVGTTDNPKELC